MLTTNREAILQRNLRKLFIYAFLSEFWLIAPVLIPYYQANGLSSSECLGVQSVYALGVILFEVPSGYLSDRIGRKSALIWGGVLVLIGLIVYALSSTFWSFIASNRRATSLSVMALVGSSLYAISGPLFGRIVDSASLSTGYFVLAGVLAIGIPVVLPRPQSVVDDSKLK